jgi:hypothetical protein
MKKRTLEEIEAIEKAEAKEPVDAARKELSELSKRQFKSDIARRMWTNQIKRLEDRLTDMEGAIDRHGSLPDFMSMSLIPIKLVIKDMQTDDSSLNKLLSSLEAKEEK